MYVDVPTCKRCCFCMPLRLGLVTFGYLRIIVAALLVSIWNFEFWYPHYFHILIWTVAALDITLNVIFVVGAHLKNHKIMKVFYYYSLVGLIVYIIYCLYHLGLSFYLISVAETVDPVLVTVVIGGQTILEILSIILQIYIILLIRSEIFKLENNLQFKFVTATGEAACRLDADDKETQEKVKYDRFHCETVYPDLSV